MLPREPGRSFELPARRACPITRGSGERCKEQVATDSGATRPASRMSAEGRANRTAAHRPTAALASASAAIPR